MSHRVARNQKQIGAHDEEAIRIMRRGGNGCFDWKTEEEAQLNRREGKQACHMDHVKRLILSAQGGAKDQVAEPSLWRGGASLFLTPEKDAAEGTRIGVKFNEWREHWQERETIQEQHRTLESQELRKQEKASSPFKVKASKRAAARQMVRTGVRFPAGPSDWCSERILTFIRMLGMYGTWPTNVSTRLSSLSPKKKQQ